MAMDLQDIRDFVRTHLDLELDDLPDVMLDTFIREGSKRIERAEARWPFYEQVYTFATTPSVDSIAKATVGADLDQVVAMTIDDARPPLTWIGVDALNQLQMHNPGTLSRPLYFTEWGGTIFFFPKPDQAYSVTLRGYRKAADWVAAGSGATPDMPDELHNTVATWALAKAYAQQEDPELASFYERQFNDELLEFQRRLTITPQSQPLILNGGPLTRRHMMARPWFAYDGGIF